MIYAFLMSGAKKQFAKRGLNEAEEKKQISLAAIYKFAGAV
jgi:hypothetical protein